ncbi:MAG: hypothetical protein JWP61_2266, partial [Friedmanniella sp.]|nr:hypothetical protein [Friedmanniella sp.]
WVCGSVAAGDTASAPAGTGSVRLVGGHAAP